MIYEKDKINRIINYKDRIIDEEIKNDLEWILEAYNNKFIDSREYENNKKDINQLKKKYYDAEDEKEKLKEELDLLKRRYKALKNNYRELQREHRLCCKKLKCMI